MAALKSEDKKAYYKVKSLSEKLSIAKATEKGQFITKDHLVEYKALIIWILNRKANFNGYLNLKEAMQTMLDKVERKEFVYKTEKGIKGIICNLALAVGLENCEENLRNANGFDWTEGAHDHPLLWSFGQFRLTALS